MPLILVNGRLSESSFQRWRYLPDTIATCCGGSTCASRARRPTPSAFRELGAPRVVTTGNLKLDVPAPPADARASSRRSSDAIGGRPVVAAASTHAGEETAVIDAHRRLRENFPGPADA